MLRSSLSLCALVLTLAACDTIGEVPDLNDLRDQYGALGPSTFRISDAYRDSTYEGTAVLIDAPVGVDLRAPGGPDDSPAGAGFTLSSEEFRSPQAGDEFEVRGAFATSAESFGGPGRVLVTAVEEGRVAGVFYAEVRSESASGLGSTYVLQGGFHAVASEED